MIDTLWSDYVEVKVELGIGSSTGTDPIFTLDDPLYGQLDYAVLGGADAPYVDVTCDVRSLAWRAGATRTDGVLTRWEAGTASVVLDNTDGAYDLSAPGSPYVPMVPLRISSRPMLPTVGAWAPEFVGYVNGYDLAFDADLDCTVTVNATDGTALLADYDAPELAAPVGAGETSAQRVQRILTEAEWTAGTRITAGGVALQATTMAADAWTQLLLVVDTELGGLYVDTDGAVVFKPRDLWFGELTSGSAPVAHFGPDDLRYEDAKVATDDSLLRNIVDAARTGGTQLSRRDAGSVSKYQPHRWGRNDLAFANDSDVADWVSVVLNTSSTPATRIDELVVWPQTDPAALWPVVLGTEYLDAWTVDVTPPGGKHAISRDVVVRGWSHVVDRELWQSTYYLSAVGAIGPPFILDAPATELDVARLV